MNENSSSEVYPCMQLRHELYNKNTLESQFIFYQPTIKFNKKTYLKKQDKNGKDFHFFLVSYCSRKDIEQEYKN